MTWSNYGFTSGMAAAAAVAAAADIISGRTCVNEVIIDAPDNKRRLKIDVAHAEGNRERALARVIKIAGPDRDITDGISVEVEVSVADSGDVTVGGGLGIGRVTRPGLSTPVGAAAINPAPLAHIKRIVRARLPGGATVVVSAPAGVELAKKTFNPKLGIVGGISILGTTGLVRPMSLEAWRTALLPQLDQGLALKHDVVVLAPGNLGAAAAARSGWPETAITQVGNFAGFMARAAGERGLDFIFVGHLGKLIKIACGYDNTHHAKTPDRLLLLSETAAEFKDSLAAELKELPSAEAAAAYLLAEEPDLLDEIARRTARQLQMWAPGRMAGALVTDLSGRIIGVESVARALTARAGLPALKAVANK